MWRLKKLLVLVPLSLLVIAGCGSSADGQDGEGEVVTKAAFIKEADAICEEADKAQNQAITAFRKEFPETKADSKRAWEEQMVVDAGLPAIQDQAEELGALSAPSGDEAEVEAIVEGLEAAVDEARDDPGSMLEKGSVGPFTEVFKLAKSYGFKACSTPI